MRFRKKNSEKLVVVEAFQITQDQRFDNTDYPKWLHNAGTLKEETLGIISSERDGTLLISTIESQLSISRGDWIIRDEYNTLHLCKPDVFVATYEPTSCFYDLCRMDK